MDSRSRPLWPILTVALIGLPVLYVASFGPACWLASRGWLPITPAGWIYAPILVEGPTLRPMRRYASLCGGTAGRWQIEEAASADE